MLALDRLAKDERSGRDDRREARHANLNPAVEAALLAREAVLS
jgi:hypothetical protein